jgi:hypothetical protein
MAIRRRGAPADNVADPLGRNILKNVVTVPVNPEAA